MFLVSLFSPNHSFIIHLFIDVDIDVDVIHICTGAGLSGFYCTNFARHVTITDGNDVVVRLLNKNLASNEVKTGSCSVKKLLWGQRQYIEECFKDETVIPNVIIGADIILWPTYTKTLLITLKYLLLLCDDVWKGIAYVSYIERAHTTTSLLHSIATEFGLEINDVDVHTFLPDPMPLDLSTLEKRLLVIRLKDPSNVDKNWMYDENTDDRSAPC